MQTSYLSSFSEKMTPDGVIFGANKDKLLLDLGFCTQF